MVHLWSVLVFPPSRADATHSLAAVEGVELQTHSLTLKAISELLMTEINVL